MCDVAAPHDAEIRKDVQTYYGQVLKKSADLKTNACVTTARPVPKHIREALQNVHEEVALRYYGCGLVIPEHLENCWILDLGCGAGRDCYVLSQLVGEKGHVTGLDMTKGQVEVAEKYLDYHMEKYGFQASNVTFIHGYIEKSNCVINLVPDKQQVLQEAYRHGGELYFSDVYTSLELPEEIRTHKVLWGDCRFVSATFRLFKCSKTGPTKRCQVIYNGGITGHEKELMFDANFTFKEGEIVEVDEETAAILKNSRFAQDFLIRPPTCPTPEILLGSCRSPVSGLEIPCQMLISPDAGRPLHFGKEDTEGQRDQVQQEVSHFSKGNGPLSISFMNVESVPALYTPLFAVTSNK
ncbi:hypothetical protein H8959_011776 [Pygathrix nigripes]